MSRYSGIVQSVEQRTVKFGAVQEKILRKTAEICGFFNVCSPNTGYNFWKKVRVFYAMNCYLLPTFLQKLYVGIRKLRTYVFAYAKNTSLLPSKINTIYPKLNKETLRPLFRVSLNK